MNTLHVEPTHEPTVTRDASAYIDSRVEPIITASYLKVAVLALGCVALLLGGLLVRATRAFYDRPMIVVRVNDVGHAEVVDYRDASLQSGEASNRYYLRMWAILYYQRNRHTIRRDYGSALYFMNGDLQQIAIQNEQKDKAVFNYERDTAAPYVDVEVKNVALDTLRQSPYGARITFDRIFTDPHDNRELKREHWETNVTYTFRARVANDELPVNPLGLTIIRFHEDQTFQ